MAWSCATWFREPCQVRKEAAVSGVPWRRSPQGLSGPRAQAALEREGWTGKTMSIVVRAIRITACADLTQPTMNSAGDRGTQSLKSSALDGSRDLEESIARPVA